jgi:hypothetical protein
MRRHRSAPPALRPRPLGRELNAARSESPKRSPGAQRRGERGVSVGQVKRSHSRPRLRPMSRRERQRTAKSKMKGRGRTAGGGQNGQQRDCGPCGGTALKETSKTGSCPSAGRGSAKRVTGRSADPKRSPGAQRRGKRGASGGLAAFLPTKAGARP